MHKTTALLSIGDLLWIISVTAFGTVIFNAVNANQRHIETFLLNSEHVTPFIAVNTENSIQIAVKMVITSSSLKSSIDDQQDMQYQFPFRYQIVDHNQHVFHQQETSISWDRGTRSISEKHVGNDKGKLTVETSFDKIKLPKSGEIQVIASLTQDDIYFATVENIELIVYDNVYQHYPMIVTGVVAALSGMVIFISGLICLASRSDVSHKTNPSEDQSSTDDSDRNWAMIIHLSAFSGYIIPFGGLLGPLIIWLTKRNQHAFIEHHGKEAVNFCISLLIYFIASFLLCFVLVGFLFLFALAIMDIILTIISAIKASDGEKYQYPLAIRFIK